MTFTDPLPGFQGHGIFEVEYVKNVLSYGQNYYSTVANRNGTMFGDLE